MAQCRIVLRDGWYDGYTGDYSYAESGGPAIVLDDFKSRFDFAAIDIYVEITDGDYRYTYPLGEVSGSAFDIYMSRHQVRDDSGNWLEYCPECKEVTPVTKLNGQREAHQQHIDDRH